MSYNVIWESWLPSDSILSMVVYYSRQRCWEKERRAGTLMMARWGRWGRIDVVLVMGGSGRLGKSCRYVPGYQPTYKTVSEKHLLTFQVLPFLMIHTLNLMYSEHFLWSWIHSLPLFRIYRVIMDKWFRVCSSALRATVSVPPLISLGLANQHQGPAPRLVWESHGNVRGGQPVTRC